MMSSQMRRRLISLLLCAFMVFNSVATLAYATEEKSNQLFKDVSPNDWYYDSVTESVDSHIFSGITQDMFSPNDAMTRAMYVTIMGRIAQVDNRASIQRLLFSDLQPDAYYLPYVMWAVEKGITQGTGENRFSPDRKITREEMATFTVRFFDAYAIPYPENTVTIQPKDLDKISPWAREAVLKLWSCGLFKGDEKGNFNPVNQATRAEAAAFSMRINEKVQQWHMGADQTEDPDQTLENPSTTYYRLSFESNGGSTMSSFSRREGGNLSKLPVPYKEGSIFGGWYYDKELTKLVDSNDVLRKSLTLYAKWGDAAPLAETETIRFASMLDQNKDFTIKILGLQEMTADEVESGIIVKNFNSQENKTWIKVSKSGSNFIVSGINYSGVNGEEQSGFEEGASYKLTLIDERLAFDGFPQEARDFNFTIIKQDVFNLSLNEKMDFINFEDISNINENGADVSSMKITPMTVTENGIGAVELVEGTFTFTKGVFAVGDTVSIYEGIHPRERVLDDTREGANGNIAYVEITSVSGTTYGYKTANVEEVLFTPDVLPVSVEADTDGNPRKNSITVAKEAMDFSDDVYTAIGLDSQTTVDKGDYISFYEGDVTADPDGANKARPAQEGYGLITEVIVDSSTYVIAYQIVTLEEMLAAMDMYNTDPIDGDEMLKDIDVEAFETEIEQQAIRSGFAESAGQYLASMAIETNAFTEISEDFELKNYEILNQDGQPLSLQDVQLMDDNKMTVKVEVDTPEASLSTSLEHFDGISGLRLTLKIKAKITIGPQKPEDGDAQIVINLTGEFEEEVHVGINVDGGARWEWWAIFPYIAEYEVTANVDLFNYTGLKFHASIVTKEYNDTKWTDNEELKNVVDELKKLVDEVKEGLGSDEEKDDPANDLIKKYKEMMDTESDWVTLVEKEMWSYSYRIPPIMIIEIKIELKFVIQANMNISLGAEFWYKTAKRYSYNVEIFAQNVSSDVLDLVEEQYEFIFYVMGTLGLRAGIKAEAKICLFTEKFASAGFGAEAGAYIKMYGYFYYQLTYKASTGKESYYAGALYFELGIYLEITFEAQAFGGTFSYNPTLYENEWPLWSAGMRENIQSFAYGAREAPELSMKKTIRTTFVPDSVFEMLYLDLKTGDSDTKIYDDSESYFNIEMTNDKFSYDRESNKLKIIPSDNDIKVDGQMVVSWINQPLAWTSKPISMKIDLYWDNLNDGYAIVFHSNGGSSIPIIIKKYGVAIESPAPPVKKGYVFDGWYSDEGLTQPYSIPETMPNEDMEVYAKWIPAQDTPYRIEHFGEALGSSQYERLDTVYLTGTTDTTVSADTKNYEGYVTPTSKLLTIVPDGSSILRYYYDRESYTLTFLPGEAQGTPFVSELKYGARITAPALNSKGYSFTGWSPALDENATMPSQDIIYTAQWSPSEDTPYRVEYYVEQTSGKYTLQRLDASKTGITGSTVALEAIFDNSYLVENGITYRDITVGGEATTTPTITKDGKLIIKVNYQRESYDATFEPNNGEESTSINVKYQGTIKPPSQNPAKQGYVFDGWTGYQLGDTMGTTDITYIAKWNPAGDTAYTIKHIREDLSGSFPASGDLVESEIKYGTTEALTEAEVKNYVGFTADSVTQTEILPDGSAVVEIKYNRNSYSVNWIAEGETHQTNQVKYGALITAPTTSPIKQGYVFAAWSGFSEGATMGIVEQTFTATWDPATDTIYRVKHIREDLEGLFTIEEIENKTGTTKTQTAASSKVYEGFTADTSYNQVEIEPDGSSVVTIFYDRNSYSITWLANDETFDTTLNVKYGAAIVLPSGTPDNKTGYTFDSWLHVPSTMPAQNSSYEVTWTANTYTVTFDVNGGETLDVSSKEVTYDSSYGALPAPTYVGYQFVNWTDASGAIVTASTILRKASDHDLTATWAADTDIAYTVAHYQQDVSGEGYTLKESTTLYGETDTATTAVANNYQGFNAQTFSQENIAGDGSTVVNIRYNRNIHTVTWYIDDATSSDDYRFGANIIEPTATRVGYTFAGWNLSVASTMPDNDLSYTATWTPKQYQVLFNGNGGSEPSAITVTYDSTYGALPTPTRKGYEFDGWFTSASGGMQIFESTKVEITEGQTLYAHWTAKAYTVSFDINTGTGTVPNDISVTYDGSYANLPTNSASKTGYTFTGWYTAANGGSKITSTTSVTTASNHILYAQWQANTYEVHFDVNGGAGLMNNQSFTYDQSKLLTANSYTKTGHSFSGWNTESDGSGTGYANTASVTNLATDGIITLYAQWTVNKYTLSFNSDGGSEVASITQNYGTVISAPANPTKNGYTFDVWQNNGVSFIFSTMPAENITLTAKWDVVNYTISYVLNGGTNHVDNPSNYNIESGHITLGDASGKVGYTFEGWYTEASCINKVDGIAIADGEMGTKTFYANWTPNTYTVSFNKNTADGTPNVVQGFTYDETAKALTANTFTREGYTFDGWNTKSDGTGTSYSNMQIVSNLVASGTLNLYAKWALVTYSITYQLNDGTQASDNPTSYTVESNDITLNDPSRVGGYGFMGWYDNATFTGNKVTSITKGSTGDKTLYAKWGFAGTFTVTNNGNSSFTIARNGNGVASDAQNVGQQIVYFRTINGSAIGGTHFVHQGGNAAAVTFADGETSKTVTITEYGVARSYDGITTTAYSNIDRTYQIALVKVSGGGLLGTTISAMRTMAKDNNYAVPIEAYDYKAFASHSVNTEISEKIDGSYNASQYTGLAGNPLTGRTDTANLRAYLQNTASAMKVKLNIIGADAGWRMYRHVFFNNHTSGTTSGKEGVGLGTLPTGTKAGFVYGITNDADNTLNYAVNLPAPDGPIKTLVVDLSQEYDLTTLFSSKYATGQSGNEYILYSLVETCGISVAAYNGASAISSWWYKGGTLSSAPHDITEPSMLGIAPMATGDYKVGETVTIAVVFDEIVGDRNNATISGTNLNALTYVSGVGSNVLYYTGTVKNDCNQDTIINGVNLSGSVKDLLN